MSEPIQHHDTGDIQPGSLPPARQPYCGHPLTAIRSSCDGTSYCADCQRREFDAALIKECRKHILAFRADPTPDRFDRVTGFVAYGGRDTFSMLDRLLDLAERGCAVAAPAELPNLLTAAGIDAPDGTRVTLTVTCEVCGGYRESERSQYLLLAGEPYYPTINVPPLTAPGCDARVTLAHREATNGEPHA